MLAWRKSHHHNPFQYYVTLRILRTDSFHRFRYSNTSISLWLMFYDIFQTYRAQPVIMFLKASVNSVTCGICTFCHDFLTSAMLKTASHSHPHETKFCWHRFSLPIFELDYNVMTHAQKTSFVSGRNERVYILLQQTLQFAAGNWFLYWSCS
jgi:hypothetical protein